MKGITILIASVTRRLGLTRAPRRAALIVCASALGLAASFLLVIPGVPGLSAAPAKAATAASIRPAMDAAGTRLITVLSSGQVGNYWKKSDGFWYGPDPIGGTARSDSPVTIDSAGNHVVFINSSGSVVEDTRNASTGVWSGPAAIGGTARAGSPLAFSGNGSTVAFVNSSGDVVADTLSGSTWSGPAAIGGTARSDSPMAINDNATHVYFVDTSGNVANDWVVSGAWKGPAGIGGTAGAGSSMATSDSGNTVAFIDPSGYVVNDWATSSGWKGPAELGGTARAGSPLALDGTPGHVYYVNSSGYVVNDWQTSSGWKGPAGVGGVATSTSGIASADSGSGMIAFYNANDSNLLNLDWNGGGYWHGPGAPDTLTSNFKGGNWPYDNGNGQGNYQNQPLVLTGLSASDTPAQAESTAESIVGNFYSDTGGNTVRIPINEATVSSSYWPTYVAAIQGMLTKGNVILCYWTQSGSGGVITNMTNYWSMWDKVVSQFGGNENAFFEPINEPHGYSSASTLVSDVYNPWLSRYSSIDRSRVILDGSGYATNVPAVGALVSGTRLAVHDYAFFSSTDMSESGWASDLSSKIGGYASRTVMTEFGDTLTSGINLDQPTGTTGSGNTNEINYFRGMTDEARQLGIGSTYWLGIGATDGYRLYTVNGTSLSLTNQSGLDRLQYGWGQ
ncbi:MAG: hypothetical protein J2P25_01885 [Nocardiopsaceae bacterium]|nr:hypothetical protein [Nocardiopsaceae bacterium]